MKVFFKLQPGTGDAARRQVLRVARASGATGVRRLFPGPQAGGLEAHFVADVPTPSAVRKVLAALQRRSEIAFAHRETVRGARDPID